jgi:hypothetical protein
MDHELECNHEGVASSQSADGIERQSLLSRDIRRVARQIQAESALHQPQESAMIASIVSRSTTSAFVLASLVLGCGGGMAAPTQRLANEQSAERSAVELGAPNLPQAQLHLQLAREQAVAANGAIRDGNNEMADRLLARATSDAELAIALTREENAKVAAQKASTQSNNQQITNANTNANANLGARP